jgi:hypothetical protein
VVLDFYQESPVPVLKNKIQFHNRVWVRFSHNWIRFKTQFWFQFQKSDPVPVWFIVIETETNDAKLYGFFMEVRISNRAIVRI